MCEFPYTYAHRTYMQVMKCKFIVNATTAIAIRHPKFNEITIFACTIRLMAWCRHTYSQSQPVTATATRCKAIGNLHMINFQRQKFPESMNFSHLPWPYSSVPTCGATYTRSQAHTHTHTQEHFYVLDELINKFAYEFRESTKQKTIRFSSKVAITMPMHYECTHTCVRSSIGRRSNNIVICILNGKSNVSALRCSCVLSPPPFSSFVFVCPVCVCVSCVCLHRDVCSVAHRLGWNQCAMRSIFIWPMTVNTAMICRVCASVHTL